MLEAKKVFFSYFFFFKHFFQQREKNFLYDFSHIFMSYRINCLKLFFLFSSSGFFCIFQWTLSTFKFFFMMALYFAEENEKSVGDLREKMKRKRWRKTNIKKFCYASQYSVTLYGTEWLKLISFHLFFWYSVQSTPRAFSFYCLFCQFNNLDFCQKLHFNGLNAFTFYVYSAEGWWFMCNVRCWNENYSLTNSL